MTQHMQKSAEIRTFCTIKEKSRNVRASQLESTDMSNGSQVSSTTIPGDGLTYRQHSIEHLVRRCDCPCPCTHLATKVATTISRGHVAGTIALCDTCWQADVLGVMDPKDSLSNSTLSWMPLPEFPGIPVVLACACPCRCCEPWVHEHLPADLKQLVVGQHTRTGSAAEDLGKEPT
jgi:hypothetical protein